MQKTAPNIQPSNDTVRTQDRRRAEEAAAVIAAAAIVQVVDEATKEASEQGGRHDSMRTVRAGRKAPVTRERSSVPIFERRNQTYDQAVLHRRRSSATFGTDNMGEWERLLTRGTTAKPLSQLEITAMSQWQLVLANFALDVLSGKIDASDRKALPKPDQLYRRATQQSLDAARRRLLASIALHRIGATRAARRHPEGSAERIDIEAMLDSQAGKELLRLPSIPWDAMQDGHLVGRNAAWRLGIVRWARQISPERALRISDALCRSDVHHSGTADGRLCWEDGRPMLFLRELTLLTVKLVHEAWLHDPRIVIVHSGRPLGRNPFVAFRIAYVEDRFGHLKGLLGIEPDADPILIEPRFASATYTTATGWIDLEHSEALRVPSFFRTLAQCAFLSRVGDDLTGTNLHDLSSASLSRLANAKENFEALMKTLPDEPPIPLDPDVKATIIDTRHRAKAAAEQVLSVLEEAERRARRVQKDVRRRFGIHRMREGNLAEIPDEAEIEGA